ncbi:MAG: M14 family zinc carboxypeptidase, partial [Anaerolineales bacterium]
MVIIFLGLGAPLKTFSEAGERDEEAVLARVHFEDQADLSLLAQSLDIWEINHDQLNLVAYLTPREYRQLVLDGYQVNIDPDLNSKIKQKVQPLAGQTSGVPGFPCYRTVEETYTSLGQLAVEVPELAAWIDIGDSWEKITSGGIQGHDIYTLVLTNSDIPGPKPKLFLMAAIHAREYATAELAARFADYLVENYGANPEITWLLDYYEVHILPIANPDGRKIAEGGIYWRKNTNNADGCSNSNLWGTDLNRNSSFKWGLAGASQDACDETFRGSAPASESETQAIQDYLAGIFADRRGSGDQDPAPIDTAGLLITLHSYGDAIFYPWGWTAEPAPNQNSLRTLGRKFGYYSGYQVCQSGEPGCIYPSSGSTDDWAYGELG